MNCELHEPRGDLPFGNGADSRREARAAGVIQRTGAERQDISLWVVDIPGFFGTGAGSPSWGGAAFE